MKLSQSDLTRLVVTLLVAIAVIVGCWQLGHGLKLFRSGESSIQVTGMAEKQITSDLIVWNITVTGYGDTQAAAFADFKQDVAQMRQYLIANGIQDSCLSTNSVSITAQSKNVYDPKQERYVELNDGYNVSQNITVSSSNLPVVEKVYQKISELYSQGIKFSSAEPLYYYTKLNDLKMELLHNASLNARERATTIAEGCDASVGSLTSTAMGVFQIVGKNSNEDYSWGGAFNTSSKEKVASITVRAVYTTK